MAFGIDQCNCGALRRAARRVSNFYDSMLAPAGNRTTQLAILSIVAESDGVSVNELAQRLDLDRTTTGKNLRPLESAGLVSIEPATADRRSRVITLTATGESTLRDAMPLWQEAQRRFEACNGRAPATALRTTLNGLGVGDGD